MTIVYCDNEECVWYQKLKEAKAISRHGGRPCDWDKYSGKCLRMSIGVRMQKIDTLDIKYKIPECRFFSVRGPAGHMDWSRFPQGGRILGSQEHA